MRVLDLDGREVARDRAGVSVAQTAVDGCFAQKASVPRSCGPVASESNRPKDDVQLRERVWGVGGDALDGVSGTADEVRAQKNLQFDEVPLDSRHALVFTHGSFTPKRIAFSQGFWGRPTNVAREEPRAYSGAIT